MMWVISKLSDFLTPALLSISISSAAVAQDTTQKTSEKQTLENMYTMILIMEFCADLELFFDDEIIENSKQISKEKIKTFSLSEAEKNESWENIEKEAKDALSQLSLANYTEKYGFCAAIRDVYKETFSSHNSLPTSKD